MTETMMVFINGKWVNALDAAADSPEAGLFRPLPEAPTEFTATFPLKDMHPEALALMTGVHPACFDPEGHALVKAIHDRKADARPTEC